MAWGVQTWDAAGKPNNYGLVPVSLIGKIELSLGQVSGSWSFTVPNGFRLDYIHQPKIIAYNNVRRLITVSGNKISLSQAGENSLGFGTEMALEAFLIVYIRND